MNPGKTRVRVTRLPAVDMFLYDLSVWTTPPRPLDGGGPRERLAPFRPFTLKPDQQVWVEYRYKMPRCPGTGAANVFGLRDAPITFKAGLITRKTTFALPHPVAVVGGPSHECESSGSN